MSNPTTGRIVGALLLDLVGLGLRLVLAIPGGLFEMVLGVTLIARGFPEPIGTPPATQPSKDNDRLGASA